MKLSSDKQPCISIVVPVFNEQETVRECNRRLQAVMAETGYPFEILYVNDGSQDDTLSILKELGESSPAVSWLNLSRNFGKEHAMTAGLQYAAGAAVIIIDADLQDPPELIPRLIEEWQNGYDNVYGRRRDRDGETVTKKLTAKAFYRLIDRISGIRIPRDTGDFRLLSRRAVNALLSMPERHRFMKGMFAWIGYHQKELLYDRDSRYAGSSKFNYWKLWNFALEGLTSFSTAPLKLATYIGVVVALGALLYGVAIIFETLVFGNPVAGYPSLMTVVLFMGGLQLLFIGIVGEYLGRSFDEVKGRPLYFVEHYHRSKQLDDPDAGHSSESAPANKS